MHIVTANLNGIRSAINKGFYDWLGNTSPDIVCVQETKAQAENNDFPLPQGYTCFFSDANKKGYSGVGIFAKQEPLSVKKYGNPMFDSEGRYLEIEYHNLIVISLYLPSGTSGPERQKFKINCLDEFYNNRLCPMVSSKKPIIICGDFNIAHKKIDLKNWQANQRKTGFLPVERAWFDKMLQLGWQDCFRTINQEPEHYTWWTYRSAARKRNVGWRIDYQISTPNITAVSANIEQEPIISDHAPLSIKYNLKNL